MKADLNRFGAPGAFFSLPECAFVAESNFLSLFRPASSSFLSGEVVGRKIGNEDDDVINWASPEESRLSLSLLWLFALSKKSNDFIGTRRFCCKSLFDISDQVPLAGWLRLTLTAKQSKK